MRDSSSTGRTRGRKSIAERERAEKGNGSVYYERDRGSELTGRWIATEPRERMKPLLFKATRGPKYGADGDAGYRQAEEKREAYRLKWARGEVNPLDGLPKTARLAAWTVSAYVEEWIESVARPVYEVQRGVEVRIGGFEQNTYENYRVLKRYIVPHFKYVLLKECDGQHISAWLDTLIATGAPPSQRMHAKKLLSTIFNYAKALGRETGVTNNPVAFNPLLRNKGSYTSPRPKASAIADMIRLITLTRDHERFSAVVPLALMLGLRRQELVGLQWQHIDFAGKTVTIALKGSRINGALKTRAGVKMRPNDMDVLPMPAPLEKILLEHRARIIAFRLRMGARWKGPSNPVEGAAWVFPAPHSRVKRCGQMVAPEHLHEWYQRQCARAGLDNTKLHLLRHNCGSFLRHLGVPMVEIRDILRHSQLATTELYAHGAEITGREALTRLGDQLAAGLESEAI